MSSSFRWRLRNLLAAVGIVALMTATVACSPGLTEDDDGSGGGGSVAVAFAWIANAHYAPYFVAEDAGFFDEEGLDVTFIPSGLNAPTATQQVASGNAQVAIASKFSDVIQANVDGADLVVLGSGFQRQVQAIITPAGNPVDSLEDLVGLRIGHQTPADRVILEGIASKSGLALDMVQVGTDPTVLEDGTVDAYVGFAAGPAVAVELGGFPVDVTLVGELGWHDYGDTIVVPREYLESNREVVVRFLAALIQGYEANIDDPEPGARAAVDNYGADLGLEFDRELAGQEFYNEAMENEVTDENGLLYMDLDHVANTIYPFFAEFLGYTADQLPAPADFIDLSPLEEAQEMVRGQ